MSVKELTNLITEHFENISKHFGYPFLPPETLMNRYGDILMNEMWYDKAYALYNMNIKNYSQSFLVYEAMRLFYGHCLIYFVTTSTSNF